MSDLKTVFDIANLRRAYRWTLSSPDAHYKSYFRDSYDAFAIASETHLEWIRKECLKDRYQTGKPTRRLKHSDFYKTKDRSDRRIRRI